MVLFSGLLTPSVVGLVWSSWNWEDGGSQSCTVAVVVEVEEEMKVEVQTLSHTFTLGAETWGRTGFTTSDGPDLALLEGAPVAQETRRATHWWNPRLEKHCLPPLANIFTH